MSTKQKKSDNKSEIHINQFDSQYDNRVTSLGTAGWVTLSDYFLSEPIVATDKTSVSLFNLAHYKNVDDVDGAGTVNGAHDGERHVRRAQESILFVDCLVLDFDDGLTIAEAKKRFKKYTYVGYTSHSHLKEDGVEKFRLLIQLSTPIPADMIRSGSGYPTKHGDWFFLSNALEDFAGPVDTSSFNSNQMYYVPSVHPQRQGQYESWQNAGNPFDWTKLPRDQRNSTQPSDTRLDSTNVKNSDFKLDPDFVLDTKDGPIRVQDVNRTIDKVVCPFHNDVVGGEFVARGPSGRVSLRCKRCGTIYMDDLFVPTLQVATKNSSSSENPPQQQDGVNSSSELVAYRIPPDYLLRTNGRHKPARNIKQKDTSIICPFHIGRSTKGNLKIATDDFHKFECDSCGPIYIDKDYDPKKDHDSTRFTDSGHRIVHPPKQPKIEDFVDLGPSYHNASDRSLVIDQLRAIGNKILNDFSTNPKTTLSYPRNRSHILYMPEGSGKSSLAVQLAGHGEKIIFACKSWDQAFAKYEEFGQRSKELRAKFGDEQGFTVDLFLSKDGKARKRFSVPSVRENPRHPYQISKINDEASIQRFKDNNPDLSDELVEVSWNFFKADELFIRDYVREIGQPDKSNADPKWDHFQQAHTGKSADLIITTHAQLRVMAQREQYIPRKHTIWIDDPDLSDVIDIERYDRERWGEMDDEELESKTFVKDGVRYFFRDDEKRLGKDSPRQSLGFNQRNHKCVYTTTETVTKQAIEKLLTDRKEQYLTYDKMNHLRGRKITILGTTKVRRTMDGIVPIVSRMLEKQGHNNILIANGLGTILNHSNNKGSNRLKQKSILVELSIPHPYEIQTYCTALGMSRGRDTNEMGRMLVLDRMHQAIGRNSGYRWEGYECVILADALYHKHLIDNVRYEIDEGNSVQIDRTNDMSRKDRRTTKSVSEFVAAVETLLGSIDQIVADSRKIKPAITHVLGQIDDQLKHESYIARLLLSLATHSRKDFWKKSKPDEPASRQETAYRNLGEWILEEFISPKRREKVLKEYSKISA